MNTRALLNKVQTAHPKLNLLLSKIIAHPSFIYGSKYREYRKKYSKSYCSYDNKDDLFKVVNHSIKNVPFYNKQYGSLKINSIKDFQTHIGLIDKMLVNENFDSFFALTENVNRYDLLTTGGTSGKPLRLYLPKSRYVQELGTLHEMWKRELDINNEFKAVIKNHRLNVPFLINPVTKEFIFDGFNFSKEYFETIYNTITKYDIKYILCYPSSGYEFAKYLDKEKKGVASLRALIASSENVQEFQVKLFTEKLGLKFFTWYGHTEKLVSAGYCSNTTYFHVEPLYGYCELIDEGGNLVNKPGNIGEIVGTTLFNYGMPLIRYRTGDYAEYLGDQCPTCGRKVMILKTIHGRWTGDRIYNKDGTYVTTTALNLHDELYLVIDGMQYYQDTKGTLIVRIVPNHQYNSSFQKLFINHFMKIMNSDTEVIIQEVNHLEKMPNGKFLLLISKV